MCRYCIKSGFQSSLSWCPSRSCIHGWWYSATISLWSLCIYYMPLRYYSLSPNKRFSFKLQKGGSWSMLTWQNDTKWFICIPNPCRWMGTQINNNFWEQKKFRLLQKQANYHGQQCKTASSGSDNGLDAVSQKHRKLRVTTYYLSTFSQVLRTSLVKIVSRKVRRNDVNIRNLRTK